MLLGQIVGAPAACLVAIALSPRGCDPGVTRTMEQDIRLHSNVTPDRRFAAFVACQSRNGPGRKNRVARLRLWWDVRPFIERDRRAST